MRSAVSKSDASLAEARGRYEKSLGARRRKPETSKMDLKPPLDVLRRTGCPSRGGIRRICGEVPGRAKQWFKLLPVQVAALQRSTDDASPGTRAGRASHRLHDGLRGFGVGGQLRAGYLHRRLALETGGEVVLEDLWPDRAGEDDAASLMISLTRMQALMAATDRDEGHGKRHSRDRWEPVIRGSD